MSLADWYHRKAEQCATMAKSASDARRRADYETEMALWLAVAAGIEKDEEVRNDLLKLPIARLDIALKDSPGRL
jgi:hypothetical protein